MARYWFPAFLVMMVLDINKIDALLTAAKDTKKKAAAKPFVPTSRQLWAAMKNGATRQQCMEAAARGREAFNELFKRRFGLSDKFKTTHDGACICHGAVIGVLEAAGADPDLIETVRSGTAEEGYEALAEFLPNGCPAYAAEALCNLYGFPWAKVTTLDEATAKTVLRLAEQNAEEEKDATATPAAAAPPAKPRGRGAAAANK